MFIQFVLNNMFFSTKGLSDAHIKNSELLRKFVTGISDLLNAFTYLSFFLIKSVDI